LKIIVILLSLLLTACSQSSSETIYFGLSSAPISLDPRFATDAASVRINRLLYGQLVDFDEKSLPTPQLATWENISPTHYRFYLKPEKIIFHNQQRLTTHDVKATYDFVLNPDNASPHRSALLHVKTLNIIDDKTIDFILTKPDSLFPGRLAIGILPADLIIKDHPFNKHPIGSGAFQLANWSQPNQLDIQRLKDGQMIRFTEVKDPVVRVLKLLRGELDILQGDLSPELITWLTKKDEINITKAKGTNFTYLGFNLEDPLTKQLKIRQAIAHAIDRKTIIHALMGNAARPASSILPPSHWAGHPNLPHYDYDLVKAKQLLQEAGVKAGTTIPLIYKTSTNPFRVRLATVIQHQLKEAGINVDLRTYDWGTFYGDIKAGRFQIYSLIWVGVKMPDIFRYVFHSESMPPNGANRGRWQNTQIDQLIEQAERAETLEQQAVIYHQLQAVIFEHLPYVPLWYEDHVLATNQRIENYQLAADGNYDGLHEVSLAR